MSRNIASHRAVVKAARFAQTTDDLETLAFT
jgi:hypothetical protein